MNNRSPSIFKRDQSFIKDNQNLVVNANNTFNNISEKPQNILASLGPLHTSYNKVMLGESQ